MIRTIQKKWQTIVVLFVLAETCFLIYSNSFYGSFHFDDMSSIVTNSAIQDLSDVKAIWDYWPSRFLTNLTFAINYHYQGLDTFGYHVVNFIIHLFNSLLVFFFVRLLFKCPGLKNCKLEQRSFSLAFFSALIFISHPIQTEAVTYIVQRATSQVTLFYLISLILYIQYRLFVVGGKKSIRRPRIYLILCFVSAICAMFTKETSIILPFLLLLLEFLLMDKEGRPTKKIMVALLSLVLIIPALYLITQSFSFEKMTRAIENPVTISPLQYFLTENRVFFTYFRLLFFPIGQNLDYDYPIISSLTDTRWIICFMVLAGMIVIAKKIYFRHRLITFSVLFFFITMMPESSFFPINDVIYEHRLYLPMIGFAIFIAVSLMTLLEKFRLGKFYFYFFIVIMPLSLLTFNRNKIWGNDIILIKDCLMKSPAKWRLHHNLGYRYYNEGRELEAKLAYETAIKSARTPSEKSISLVSLATYYKNRGEHQKAIELCNIAIETNPQEADAYSLMAIISSNAGDIKKAIEYTSNAIRLKPDNALYYYNRGIHYFKIGDYSNASMDFELAISKDKKYTEAYQYRDQALRMLRDSKKT
jgi:hypothetical protein